MRKNTLLGTIDISTIGVAVFAHNGATLRQLSKAARHLPHGAEFLGGLQANKAFMDNPDLPGDSSAPAIRASDVHKAAWAAKTLEYARRTGIMLSGEVLMGGAWSRWFRRADHN